jgi:hypothetical protein
MAKLIVLKYAWSNAKHKNGEVEAEEQKQPRGN